MTAAIHTSIGNFYYNPIGFLFVDYCDKGWKLSLIDDDGEVWFCITVLDPSRIFVYKVCQNQPNSSKLKQTNYSKIYLSSEGEKGEAYRTAAIFHVIESALPDADKSACIFYEGTKQKAWQENIRFFFRWTGA